MHFWPGISSASSELILVLVFLYGSLFLFLVTSFLTTEIQKITSELSQCDTELCSTVAHKLKKRKLKKTEHLNDND